MKIISAALLLLLAPESSAFFAAAPPRGETTALFGFRQSYQYNLEQYTRTGNIEIGGKQVSLTDATQQIDEDLQASQEEGVEAQQRLSSVEEQISAKEQEQTLTVEAFQAEIQKQQLEMQERFNDMSNEAAIEANKAKMAAIEEFKAREQQVQEEMDKLYTKFEEEKDHVRQNQVMTNRILTTRVELDLELGLLKKKYEIDSKEWESKLQQEQQAHGSDLANAEADVARLKKEVEQMTKERTNLSSLFTQSLKVMFGTD